MKALEKYSKKRFRRLRILLKSFTSQNEEEALHQIRIEIKKIRTILLLIHFNKDKFDYRKHFKSLRAIFRMAGKIRDSVVCQQLLNLYTPIHAPFYRSRDKNGQLFSDALPKYIKEVRKQKRIVLNEIRKIKSLTYQLYLENKNIELNDLLLDANPKKDLHSLRKLIKEITYLTLVKKNKNQIDPMLIDSSTIIGRWHDKQVLITWIQSQLPNEKAVIKQLKSESSRDLKELREILKKKYHSIELTSTTT